MVFTKNTYLRFFLFVVFTAPFSGWRMDVPDVVCPAHPDFWVDFYAPGGTGEKTYEWFMGFEGVFQPLIIIVGFLLVLYPLLPWTVAGNMSSTS